MGQPSTINHSKTTGWSSSHYCRWCGPDRAESESFYPGNAFDLRCRGKFKLINFCSSFKGYGQTENYGGISGTFFANYHVDDGTVGTVLPCGAIKLVDVKDTVYLAKNNQGEICYKGNNLMKGYFKNEAKTKETIDSEGWLHTGDIGEWTENGCLKIIV